MAIPDAQGRTPPKRRPPKPKPLSSPHKQGTPALQNQVPQILTGPRTKAKTGATTVDWGTANDPSISAVHAVVAASPRVKTRSANIRRGAAPGGGPGSRERGTAVKLAKSGSTLQIQRELNRHGFHIAEDGQWGPQTAAAWSAYTGTLAHGAVANANAQDAYLRQAVVSHPQHGQEMATLGPEKYKWLQDARKEFAKEIEAEQQRQAMLARIPKLEAARPGQEAAITPQQREQNTQQAYEAALDPITSQLAAVQKSQLGGTAASNLLWGQHLYSPLTLITGRALNDPSQSALMGGANAAMVVFPMLRPLRAVKAGVVAAKVGVGALLRRGAEEAVVTGAEELAPHAAEGLAVRELSPAERRLLRIAERAAERLAPGEKLPEEYANIIDRVAARQSEHLAGPVAQAARGAYRNPTAVRVFKSGAMKVIVPAARSRTGRLVEHALDTLRPGISRVTRGAYKSPGAKAFEELGRHARYQSRIDETYARALTKVARKLNDAKEYALRIVAEGVHPDERAAHHTRLAEAAAAGGDDPSALYHSMHADMIRQAAKYIDATGEVPVLRKDAPIALHKALDLLVKVAGSREDMYRTLGRLSDDMIAGRLIAPARVLNGAVWREHEAMLREALDASPTRVAAEAQLRQVTNDPVEINAAMTMWDAMVRSAALQSQGDQRAFSEVLKFIRGLEFGDTLPEGMHALYQGVAPPPVEGLPDSIDAARIARAVRGLPQPSGLNMTKTVRAIYDMAREGARYRDWYHRAAENVLTAAHYERVEPKVMAQLIALYSQQAMPTANMGFAIRALRDFKTYGEIRSLGPGGNVQRVKAEAILTGQGWSGRKTNSFYQNIMKYIDPEEHASLGGHPVTVDRHVIAMFEPAGSKSTRERYSTYERIFQEMADELGWAPEEVQAAAWVTMKQSAMARRYGGDPAKYAGTASDAYERGVRQHLNQEARPIEGAAGLLGQVNPDVRAALREAAANGERIHVTRVGDEVRVQNLTTGEDDYHRLFLRGEEHRLDRQRVTALPTKRDIKKTAKFRGEIPATPGDRRSPFRAPGGRRESDRNVLYQKSDETADVQKAVAAAAEPDGGFTLDSNMKPHTTGGYAVAIFPDRNLVVQADTLTPEMIVAYRDHNLDLLTKYPSARVGGWHDPETGEFHFDVSETTDDPNVAMMLARENDQKAIFDFQTFKSIPTIPGHIEDELARMRDEYVKGYDLRGEQAMRNLKRLNRGQPKRLARTDLEAQADKYLYETDEHYKALADTLDRQPPPDHWLAQEDNHDAYDSLRSEMDAWEAFGRDIRLNLPREEWPQWARNQEWSLFNDRMGEAKKNRPPYPDRPGKITPLPGESEESIASRKAAAEQDFLIRKQEWVQKYGEPDEMHARDIWEQAKALGFDPHDPHTAEGGRLLSEAIDAIDELPDEHMRDHLHGLLGNGEYERALEETQDYPAVRRALGELVGHGEAPPETFPDEWLAQGRHAQGWMYYDNIIREATGHDPEKYRPILKAFGQFPPPRGREEIVRGIHAAVNAAIDTRQSHLAGILLRESQGLFQRGGSLDTISPYGIKAAIHFTGKGDDLQTVIHFTEESDLSSWIHEWAGHFFPMFLNERDYKGLAKWAGGNFDPRKGEIDVAAAERVARGMEEYWRRGHAPAGLGNVARTVAPRMRELYEGGELPDYPPNVEAVFSRMFNAPRLKGGMLVGAEDIGPVGLARVPTVRGRPLPRGVTGLHRKVAAYTRYILSGGKIIGKGPDDVALRKAYEGAALRSGYFTFDVVKPTTQDLILASRLSLVHKMREELIRAGSPLPKDVSDIAVKINPDEQTPKEIETLLERMREIDSEGGKLTQKDLSRLDPALLETAQRDIFPARLTEADGTERDVRTLAGEIMNSQEPIDNIVWVPREHLAASGLIPRGISGGTTKALAVSKEAGLMTLDIINDMQKAMILYLNPSYIPINLAGNLVMNVMHQGVFTPINLWKSALMHQTLDIEHRMLVDNVMGNGLTASMSLKTGPGQLVHSTLGHWINLAVDLVPRRSAFLHEARRRGYKSSASVRDLLQAALEHDEEARHVVEQIGRQANDAIVDYERMSPLEREITSRLIFFYPWLKGATRYALRFPLEHPAQAMALMMLGEHAKVIQDQRLGETPFYANTAVPIDTRSVGLGVPGNGSIITLADIVGDKQWNVDRNGQSMPEVVNARQLLTFTTPLDLYGAGIAFIKGDKNAPAVIENLTPAVYSGIVALSGYDPFRHKEVPQSLATFITQLEDVPQAQRYHQITLTDAERRQYQTKSLYPRSKNEEITRLFFSGLAPTPYNRAVAAERLLADAPTKVRHVEQAKQDQTKYKLDPLTPEILAELDQKDDMDHEIKRGMNGLEKLRVVAKYYKQAHPEFDDSWIEKVPNEGTAEHYYGALREALFPQWHLWDYKRQKAKSAANAVKPVTP